MIVKSNTFRNECGVIVGTASETQRLLPQSAGCGRPPLRDVALVGQTPWSARVPLDLLSDGEAVSLLDCRGRLAAGVGVRSRFAWGDKVETVLHLFKFV